MRNPSFAAEVQEGLAQSPKRVSPKFLYDPRGSALFEQICECPEYYVTRTETAILEARGGELARRLGEGLVILEFGSGASRKTRILLDALPDVSAYMPIDISRDFLFETARELQLSYPRLAVRPVCADFSRPLKAEELEFPANGRDRLAFFPGSTIGNFDPPEARIFLGQTARLLRPGGWLLIGVDLIKDRETLELAYDDPAGLTAQFNLNLLHRMRRELDAQVDVDGFRHLAIYNAPKSRIEMHLVSLREQEIRIEGDRFGFEQGETIHTESSYKYSPARLSELAKQAGYTQREFWTDPANLFGVGLYEVDF